MSTVISIASGKGGVGKSFLAVNLALRLQSAHQDTLLVDTDLVMANSHILLGYRPQRDIVGVIEGEYTLRDAIQRTPHALSILPGRSGVDAKHNVRGDPLPKLVPQLRSCVAEMSHIVVDAAAGSGPAVLNSLRQADHAVVVLQGQATSFVDAYTLIKNVYLYHGVEHISLIVNAARDELEARALYRKFAQTVKNFIPVTLTYCGHMLRSDVLHQSSVMCQPIVLSVGAQRFIPVFDTIIAKILASPRNTAREFTSTSADAT